MAALLAEDLIELCALLARTVERCAGELAELNETVIPLPEAMVTQLEEHAALVGTMKWLRERLPASIVEEMKARYRVELGKHNVTEGLEVPVLPEVLEELDDVLEVLRRAQVYAPELR